MASTSDQDSTKQQFEQCLGKYLIGDDSSDEEDEVVSYKVVDELRKFQKAHKKSKCLETIKHNNLSFIAHAVAIKFLYCPTIQKAYYAKKKNAGNPFQANFDYEKLKIAINRAAEHIVLFQTELDQNVVESVISEKIFSNLHGFFEALENNKLKDFFKELTDENGSYRYYVGDLLGFRFQDELGQLRLMDLQKFDEPSKERTKSLVLLKTEPITIEFFSNLRLHNRLEKRRMKLGLGLQTSTWKYSDRASVEITHGSSHYRSEEVKFGELETASYATIYDRYPSTLRDKDEFPEIFTKGPKQLSQFDASLHYLLFGTEVMRNPSALIHNMMMFDLIKNGKLTWKEAFEDRRMPMSMRNAVTASRIKNILYENFMPHKYLYDKYKLHEIFKSKEERDGLVSHLLEQERQLTKQWLEIIIGVNENIFNEHGDIKTKYVNWFFNTLETECQRWYNVDISTGN